MLRVFAAKSEYGYEIEEIDPNNESIKNFPQRFLLPTPERGGVEARWDWAGKENPYPNDQIMSAAAFLCYNNHIVRPQYGRLREIAYEQGSEWLYYR